MGNHNKEKNNNIYAKNKNTNKITIAIMVVVMIGCLGFIGYVFTTMNGKGVIEFNDLSNSQVDAYINKDKYNGMDREATEVVTKISDGCEVYGYASETNEIIPEGLCTGTKSKIGIIGVYLGDKDGTLMAAYKMGKTYYYYVTDDMSRDDFVDFIKSQWN